MKLIINGKQEEVARNMTVQELLYALKVESPDMVSVELNGTILRRAELDATPVRENDAIEFLYFMGGGSHS